MGSLHYGRRVVQHVKLRMGIGVKGSESAAW